ncbi:MAG: aminotransferase class III-fold pyridoxal phosphate-dependent enzyme, partial [Candidatus Tectomicrobia bacterium]|nr:aminotransferase class III-fold pyridoxal phosphate-dependent enzyme [Candidatus Tectomicrobia bacterium]
QYLYERAVSILQEKHPSVGFVGGGLGLLMSIEMVKNRKTKERYPGGPSGDYAKRFTEKLRSNGLATRVGDSIILSPPLTITREIIDDIIDILDVAIGEMEEEFPPDEA